METSASFEARYAPLPYPTNQMGTGASSDQCQKQFVALVV